MADLNPKGISFPFRFSNAGGVRQSSGIDKVKDNLACLAKTTVNERLIRKGVGTIGYSRVLRNNNTSMSIGVIRDLIREALTQHERRAVVLDVRIVNEEIRDGMATFVEVDFIYRRSGDQASVRSQIA